MEKEISDVKIIEDNKEILITYTLKPEYFTKNPLNLIKLGERLDAKGSVKNIVELQEMFITNFDKFSLNYKTLISPFSIIKDEKVQKEDFYIKIYHQYYPCIISFFSSPKEEQKVYPIAHSGHIEGIFQWEDKIVAIGFNNYLYHQLFIALLEKKGVFQFAFVNNDLTDNVLSYYLLGYNAMQIKADFILEKGNLKIKTAGDSFILKPNGDLEELKNGVGEITKKFIKDCNNIKYLIVKENFEKAKEKIEENLKLSEIFEIYGWSIVFASLLSDMKFYQGKQTEAVDLCLEYAKKYEKYGFDLNNKAAF